jgi:hypothetical protein
VSRPGQEYRGAFKAGAAGRSEPAEVGAHLTAWPARGRRGPIAARRGEATEGAGASAALIFRPGNRVAALPGNVCVISTRSVGAQWGRCELGGHNFFRERGVSVPDPGGPKPWLEEGCGKGRACPLLCGTHSSGL